MKPKLQIALDNNTLEGALSTLRELGDVVDVIEVGTILCLAEGMRAVSAIRALFPDKIILADTKCADAGATVAKNCREAGANWMTVICCATIPTMQAALTEIEELQVELYGNWTFEQAQQWKDIGISQVVYHQSRDALLAGATWTEEDFQKIRKLNDMGFKVSVTGGLHLDSLDIFKDLNVYSFIAGRGLRDAKDPRAEANKFQAKISELFE